MRHSDENTASEHEFPTGRAHILGFHPWQENANGSLETDVYGEFAVGYHFTPSIDGYAVELGGYFNRLKRVKLFEKGETLPLRFLRVDPVNSWGYRPTQPIPLKANTTYTVAVYIAGPGGSIYHNPTPFPQTYGDIRIEGTTAISTDDDPQAVPTNTTTDIMYGQADFRFAPYASVMGCLSEPNGDIDITEEVCSRIPHFSDPNIRYQGYDTGTNDRNNAAVARQQVGPYSRFRTNHAPVCQNDSLRTSKDTRLDVYFNDLLSQDTDPDGDRLILWGYDIMTAQGGENDSGHIGIFHYTPPPGFVGTDWFFYTVRDRNHGAGLTDTCVVYVEVTPPEVEFAEVGTVINLTHVPQTVSLSRVYSNPVVIAQTPSQNGSNPSVVRITDVRSNRFTFYVDEAPNMRGSHYKRESVSYLVLEAGNWRLADGTEMRAGHLQTSRTVGRLVANNWETVSYGGTFPAVPVVLSQVQTNHDPSWVKTRHTSIGSSTFLVGLEKEEASTVSHGNETVGWVAIQPAAGDWTAHPYRAGRTPNAVTDAWYAISFGGLFTTPHFFAAIASYDGADNSALRYQNLSSTSVEVRVEEETTEDIELGHTNEVVDYLVISGAGTLRGFRH